MIQQILTPQRYFYVVLRLSLVALINLMLFAAQPVEVAQAATRTVCASGCNYTTIQAAINNAGTSNGDTIRILDAVHTENAINISKNLILEGLGIEATIVQAAAAPSFSNNEIFIVNFDKVVTFRDMTIRYGGLGSGFNGAIELLGPVTMERVKITQNWVQKNGAIAQGGAIYTQNTLTITHSIISDNQVKSDMSARGGGIFANIDTNLVIINSRIINNQAIGSAIASGNGTLSVAEGGGIFVGNMLDMKDSEVSENEAHGGSVTEGTGGNAKGGGIHAAVDFIVQINITNSTISGNKVVGGSGPTNGRAEGGGIHDYSGTLNFVTVYSNTVTGSTMLGAGIFSQNTTKDFPILKNSIFSHNSGPINANGPDLYGKFVSQDYNLIENYNGYTFMSGTTTHNQTGVDPLLAPLVFNGGSTQTHALRETSPAFNAIPSGSNGCTPGSTWDQIGIKRPMFDGCDIGAYEMPYLLFMPIVER